MMDSKCFDTRSEMTAMAEMLCKELDFKMIRCRLNCEHANGSRSAILIVDNNTIVRKFIRCKTCKNLTNLTNGKI